MTRHSEIFEAGTIVRIPFPFVEVDRRRVRPALIISQSQLGPDAALLWALMITSAADKTAWPNDLPVGPEHLAMGLPVPCVIRADKIMTLPVVQVERVLGRAPEDLMARVRQHLARTLDLRS